MENQSIWRNFLLLNGSFWRYFVFWNFSQGKPYILLIVLISAKQSFWKYLEECVIFWSKLLANFVPDEKKHVIYKELVSCQKEGCRFWSVFHIFYLARYAASKLAKTTINKFTPHPQNGPFFFGGGGGKFFGIFSWIFGVGTQKSFGKTLGQSRCFGIIIGQFRPLSAIL